MGWPYGAPVQILRLNFGIRHDPTSRISNDAIDGRGHFLRKRRKPGTTDCQDKNDQRQYA
jgi:hypothetical protein